VRIDETVIASQYIYPNKMAKNKSVKIEHYNKEEFKKFCDSLKKPSNSFLQKYVVPKNKNNSAIKATWTPHFSILEKFPWTSSSSSVNSPTLANDILKACRFIANHIKWVTKGDQHVKRIILFFKIDLFERMYLLFWTELITRENISMIMKIIPETVIPTSEKPAIKLGKIKKKSKRRLSVPNDSNQTCSRWNLLIDSKKLYPISYKYLLDPIDYNTLLTQEQKKSNFCYYPTKSFKQILPIKKWRKEDYIAFPPVKNDNIFEKLTVEKMQTIESNRNIWKDKMVDVWENCYLILTTNQFASPKEKWLIQKRITDFEMKYKIAPKTARGIAHYNLSKVERFSTHRYRSNMNQGKIVKLTQKSAKNIKGKYKYKSTIRIGETRKFEETDELMDSDFSFDTKAEGIYKSSIYVNPIMKKYGSIPEFRL
jgi:hypothetical protein